MTRLEGARWWWKQGVCPVAVAHGKKKPMVDGWPTQRLTEAELPKHFNGRGNVGVKLGEPAADVDCDCLEALKAWPEYAPETRRKWGRKSMPASHWLYWLDPPIPSIKFIDPLEREKDKGTLIELRCLTKDGRIGMQSVAPPSVHESGEPIRFDDDGAIGNVEADVLRTAVTRTAVACLIARYFPPEKGGRNDAFLALAGMLLRAGWSVEETTKILHAIYRILWSSPDFVAAKNEVEATYRRFAGGGQIYAYTKLCELIDKRVVDKAMKWLGIQREQPRQTTEDAPRQSRTEATDTWPDPLPLAVELSAVELCTPDMLPISLRPRVVDIADRHQVPLDYPAAAMVLTVAGAVGRRVSIQPKEQDSGWTITPNIYGALVGRPGVQKSPVIDAITLPLRTIQDEWFREHEKAMAEAERARELHTLEINAWKQNTTAALREKKPAADRPLDLAADPQCKRLIVSDATVEALHKAMVENPAGVLTLRDELTGWLAQLDKPGRECERAFALEAWNGTGGFTMDRITRGRVHAPYVCLSVLGGIQPGRLRSYLSDALTDGPGDDGLIQRFQVIVWPDPPTTWKMVDRKPDRDAERTAEQVLQRLVALPASTPPMLFRFAPDAQALFNEWYADLQLRLRNGTLPDALAAHLSKYASLMPSIAVLCELADQAAWGGDSFNQLVDLEHTRQAAVWCDYLESHARRVYGCVLSPQLRAAQELSVKLRRGEVGQNGVLALRDIYRAGWSHLNTPELAGMAVKVLEDLDWLREIPTERSPGPGRPPAARYAINPKARQS